jgi:TonB family protein
MMTDIAFGRYAATFPEHRRVSASGYGLAVAFHVALLIAVLFAMRHTPVRMSSAGTATVGIAAYVPGPTGTAGSAATEAPPVPKRPAPPKAMRAQATPPPDASAGSGQTTGAGDQQGVGSGPVRLGSGGNLTLLNKVTPVYPPLFEKARIPGTVVLDAVIRRDGTIGDVRVLKSTNDPFAQAAVTAVRQWRYTPLPYEGIVTVTVNFTMPG